MLLSIYVFLGRGTYFMDCGSVSISATSEESAWKNLKHYLESEDSQQGTRIPKEIDPHEHFELFEAIPQSSLRDGLVIATSLPLREAYAF